MKNISPKLGDSGKAAYLIGEEKLKENESIKKTGINVILSNKIPLQRKLPDVRNPLCKNINYNSTLPVTSVIIIFHNEPFSLLLRTVYSVIEETPPKLLKEIILVDDKSTTDVYQGLLEYYIQTRLIKIVKLVRLNERKGLIQARLTGAEKASGDILVFLDAHCEVTKEWLQPLLQRIKEKRNVVAMPIIDTISKITFKYYYDNVTWTFLVAGFTWSGYFLWINIQKKDQTTRTSIISPANSPTMAGGIFAINRKYFWEIGSYDEKMEGWGGENLEMAFRIWQCGGALEVIPCSRVGHVYRSFKPYELPMKKDTHAINTARLVNVWMDNYKRLYYLYSRKYENQLESIDDIRSRIKLRQDLKCKSFKWYLNNVYPEKFILDENVQAFGKIRMLTKNLCLDSLQRGGKYPYNLGVYWCHTKLFPSQTFSLTNKGEFRNEFKCATVTKSEHMSRSKVQVQNCDQIAPDEKKWILTKDGNILHLKTRLCLDGTNLNSGEDIIATICIKSPGQLWQWNFYTNNKNATSH